MKGAGKEEENVAKWIDRISQIARLYQFKDDVLLLASISQLKERALEWYNRQPLEAVSSWEEIQINTNKFGTLQKHKTSTSTKFNLSRSGEDFA